LDSQTELGPLSAEEAGNAGKKNPKGKTCYPKKEKQSRHECCAFASAVFNKTRYGKNKTSRN